MAITVMVVIMLALGQMMFVAVDNQRNATIEAHQTGVMSTFLANLRLETMEANSVTLPNANQVNLTMADGSTRSYTFAGTTFTRTVGGTTIDYLSILPPSMAGTMQFGCGNPCFTLQGTDQLRVNQVVLQDTSAANTAFDTEFGKARFFIPEVTINKMANYEFM
jgi:Tfp pilus assembly protein PilV